METPRFRVSLGCPGRLFCWTGVLGSAREIHHALLVCTGPEVAVEDLGLPARAQRSRGPAVVPGSSGAEGVDAGALERALLALFERNLPNVYEHVERTLLRARLIAFGEIIGTLRSSAPGWLVKENPPVTG